MNAAQVPLEIYVGDADALLKSSRNEFNNACKVLGNEQWLTVKTFHVHGRGHLQCIGDSAKEKTARVLWSRVW